MNSEWQALATLVMFSLLQMGMAVKVCYLLMIVQKGIIESISANVLINNIHTMNLRNNIRKG